MPSSTPFGRDEGSQEGLLLPVRMGGAETNRRSPLLHATPVLLSPSQGCIPAWDDEEVPPHIFSLLNGNTEATPPQRR